MKTSSRLRPATPGRPRSWRIRLATGATLLGLITLGPAAAAQATTDTWTGQGATTNPSVPDPDWQNPDNWSAGAPTSSSPEALTFPADLANCPASGPGGPTCYSSNNDVTGVTASSLTIDAGSPYVISGDALTIGSGGITATAPSQGEGYPEISLPLMLGSSGQTWSIAGGGADVQKGLAISSAIGGDAGSESDSLAINLSNAAFFALGAVDNSDQFGGVTTDDEVGPLTIAGANSSDTGDSASDNGTVDESGGNLNGGDGDDSPVTLEDVVFDVQQDADLTTGPLSSEGADLAIGGYDAAQLNVNGAATLDGNTATSFSINGTGSTVGTDYSQLTATGDVTLGGSLSLGVGGSDQCPTFTPGASDTLVSTTGTLTGTFNNAPNGSDVDVQVFCGGDSQQTDLAQINYTGNSVTATFLASSTTSVSANPTTVVTNQPVTLTATVSSTSAPMGSVAFENEGSAIAGCGSDSVSEVGSSGTYTATCTTTFDASQMFFDIAADFTPSGGDAAASSSDDNGQEEGYSLTVNPQDTTTSLTASSSSPAVDSSVTYTATVAPTSYATPTLPGYTVEFFDGSNQIDCTGASDGALTMTNPDTATCTTAYTDAGTHSITAAYQGDDGNFNISTSSPVTVTATGGSTSTAPSSPTTPTSPSNPTTPTTPSSPTTPTAPAAGTGTSKVGSPKTSASTATVPVSCKSGGASCTVKLTLTTVVKKKVGKGKDARTVKVTVVIGTASETVGAGKSASVKVALNGTGRKLLTADHKLSTKLTVTSHSGKTTKTVASKTVGFTAKKKKK